MAKDAAIASLRKALCRYTSDNYQRLSDELDSLQGEKYVSAYTGLLEFCIPKLARLEVEQNVTLDISSLSDAELKLLDKLSGKLTETAFSQN